MSARPCIARPLEILLAALLLSSCSSPPDISKRIDGPGNGVTYVIETFYGKGAAVSDFTKVFAAPQLGKGERVLVLSGEYLDIRKIEWVDAKNVQICLNGGRTDSYRTEVVVDVKGGSVIIRNHLFEGC